MSLTPNLPNKLWRPLSEVKAFVTRMPDGVYLPDLKAKVASFRALNNKEQAELINFIRARENILVLECRPLHAKRTTLMFRHKRYGHPNEMPGFEYPIKKQPTKTPDKSIEKTQETTMQRQTKTPAQLRKEAEELLRAAEAAEKLASESDLFNKKLAPVKLEVLQAVGAAQRKFDELMDCFGVLEKAAQKLKELSA